MEFQDSALQPFRYNSTLGTLKNFAATLEQNKDIVCLNVASL